MMLSGHQRKDWHVTLKTKYTNGYMMLSEQTMWEDGSDQYQLL